MRIVLALALSLATTPAFAWTGCEDLWFSRNQVFDQAGFCFSSPLGKALFDNADCVGPNVTLDRDAQALVDFIRSRETELACAVDTDRTNLDIPNLWMRQQLERPVALSEYASGCIGWRGASFPLRAGPRMGSPVLVEALPGDQIVWEYEAVVWPEGWSFLTLYRGDDQVGLGWYQGAFDHSLCTSVAG